VAHFLVLVARRDQANDLELALGEAVLVTDAADVRVAAHVRQARRSLAGAISRKLARTVPTTAAISREIA